MSRTRFFRDDLHWLNKKLLIAEQRGAVGYALNLFIYFDTHRIIIHDKHVSK